MAASDSVPHELYQAVGGSSGCRRLAAAFYGRVEHDPVLRPLFPGKTMRCAIDAFAAFLSQCLGGAAEDAEPRWWLSLRESHARFEIGVVERDAWMKHMTSALGEMDIDERARRALLEIFEHASAYIAHGGQRTPEDRATAFGADRAWREQVALDDLVAAIRAADADGALALAEGAVLAPRLGRDPAVFAHVLTLMMDSSSSALSHYVERAIRADPALVNARNRHGRTLLHDASAQGNLYFVELLLRLGADPNARTSGGHTPLYCAANECRTPSGGDVVRELVRGGADVNAPSDAKRCTALHMAARRGHVKVAEALLACGADVSARDRSGVTPLRRAINCRQPAVASLLELSSAAG